MDKVERRFEYFVAPTLEGTPLQPLLPFVHHSIERIAPERATEVLGMGIVRLGVLDDTKLNARAWPGANAIEISGRFIEALWCAAFAYWTFRVVLEEQMATPAPKSGRALEITAEDKRVDVALGALQEAKAAAVEQRAVDWHKVGVHPALPPVDGIRGTFAQSATEMTLTAVGFILHHELAHVRLSHTVGDEDWTLDQEKDADSEAICMILGGVQRYALDDTTLALCAAKRGWGILIATGFLNDVRGERDRRRGRKLRGGSHPVPFARMDKAVQHEAVQSDARVRETIESLACAILVPHLRIAGRDLPTSVEDHRALYQACLDALATD